MGWARKNISGGSDDLVKRAVTAAKDVKPSGKAPPTKSNKKRSYSFSKGKAASEKGTPEKAAPEKAAPKPAKRRRSSFGRGASQPPTPAPQQRARNPELQQASAKMDAARARQQSRSGGTPGGPSTTNPGGNRDMNLSSARGTGTPRATRAGVGAPPIGARPLMPGGRGGFSGYIGGPKRSPMTSVKNAAAALSGTGTPAPAPKTGLPDGFKPNMPIVGSPSPAPKSIGTNPAAWENMPDFSDINMQEGRRPHTPATNFGGQIMRMKKGGGVKKGGKAKAAPSRGNGIAKRGLGKGRMR